MARQAAVAIRTIEDLEAEIRTRTRESLDADGQQMCPFGTRVEGAEDERR